MSCTHYEKHEIQLLGRTKTKPYTRDAIFFSVAQKPNFGLGRLIVEVSRSYTIRNTHTRPVGLLWTSDQPVAEAATYTTQTNTRHEQLHRQWGSNPQLQQPRRLRPHGHRYRLGAILRPTIKHQAVNIEYYARLNFRSNYPARKLHVFGVKLLAARHTFPRPL